MIDLRELQDKVYANKLAKGFNTTNIPLEFSFVHEEVSEAFRAYMKKLPDLGEELADIAIFLLGLSALLGIDLETEIKNKIEKNHIREYKRVDGILTRVKG